jgi:FAD/FMN-containing dehydrogenase
MAEPLQLMPSTLVVDLQRLLAPERVSNNPEDLERFAGDALAAYRAFGRAKRVEVPPIVVATPKDTNEVSAVAAYASKHGIPIIPHGGGTGVMGGAVPVDGSIVLNLRSLDVIHQIDREGHRVTVGAGAILEDLENALIPQGLLLGHDPWSRPIATVGGAISTNGMGYLAGKYGSMGQQIQGLEVVLGSGDVIQTPSVPKIAGPDLDNIFIGAEGAMGIITKATLEAFPQPEVRSIHAFRFASFAPGFTAVQEMYAIGLRPAMVDFAEEYPREPLKQPEEGITTLYLSFDGFKEEVAAQVDRGRKICLASGGEELPFEEADTFWRERHNSAERYKREIQDVGPSARRRRRAWRLDYLHVAIPASRVLEYYAFCRGLLIDRGIPVREWSLWGRPEYFSLMISDPSADDRGDSALMSQAVDDILTAAQDLGGSMEYCHGVGLKLTHLMQRDRGEAGMQALRNVKKALDPMGILHPGNLGI